RQDYNIYSTVPISYAIAALGGDVVVDTVDGKVIYEVKAGTQTETKVRLKGKGVPTLHRSDIRGDHYVTLVVQTPERLSQEAKDLLRRFDELTGNSLHAAEQAGDGSDPKERKKKFWK
ncbi:MAG: molecular chaperone DnaJ, partial [Lachnospiraceae bacterium]|nr:molecular chaperone DnaJ [Lachnospiraceae bacterium]